MSIKLKNFGGNLTTKQEFKDSEIDSEALDIEASDFKGDANIEQTVNNVKSLKGFVWILVSLLSILSLIYRDEIKNILYSFF
jgi:hypothetical protein